MFVGVSVIEILHGVQPEEAKEEHGKTVKVHITRITPVHVLQDFLDFLVIISFQHVLHFDVGRS